MRWLDPAHRRARPKGHETFILRAASTSSHRLLQRRLLSAHTAQNTTYLRCAGSHNAVTWDFMLVWRRRGTPGRRWVSNPRLSQESLVQSCLRSAAGTIRPAGFPVAGTPAGTVVVRAADLLVRGAGTVTAGGAGPPAGAVGGVCAPPGAAPRRGCPGAGAG